MDVIISALIEANKLLNKKDYYKALDCFECVLNINPTNNLAIIGKTICIHYLKSFDNSSLINMYEEKLNVNLKLAELYECGKYDETITECNKILKKDKNNFNVLAIKFSAQFLLVLIHEHYLLLIARKQLGKIRPDGECACYNYPHT